MYRQVELLVQGFSPLNIKRNFSHGILFYVHANFIASK